MKSNKGFPLWVGLLLLMGGISLVAETRQSGSAHGVITPDKISQFLRDRFGVPDNVKLTAEPLRDSSFAGFRRTVVKSDDGKQNWTTDVYVSKDGRYLVLGNFFGLGPDPKADIVRNVRELSKLPPTTELAVGPFTKSAFPEFLKLTLTTNDGKNKQTGDMFATRDKRIGFMGNVMEFQQDAARMIVTKNQPSVGPANAPVTIVEYADLQCPSCALFHHFLEKDCLPRYGKMVRIIFKEFPLPSHDWSASAAIANECAYEIAPSAFLNYRSLIFANQGTINAGNVRERMLTLGEQAGIDRLKLAACIDSQASWGRVEACRQEGEKLGILKTPTTFVNGRRVIGVPAEATFERIVEEALAAKPFPGQQKTKN